MVSHDYGSGNIRNVLKPLKARVVAGEMVRIVP